MAEEEQVHLPSPGRLSRSQLPQLVLGGEDRRGGEGRGGEHGRAGKLGFHLGQQMAFCLHPESVLCPPPHSFLQGRVPAMGREWQRPRPASGLCFPTFPFTAHLHDTNGSGPLTIPRAPASTSQHTCNPFTMASHELGSSDSPSLFLLMRNLKPRLEKGLAQGHAARYCHQA